MRLMHEPSPVFWLYGRSGAGKTTLSAMACRSLQELGWSVFQIDGDVIRVDMGKAREIKKDRLRELRTPILAQLDKALERATDQRNNDEAERIRARRQALRDVTTVPEIAAARTPEELKDAGMDVIEAG